MVQVTRRFFLLSSAALSAGCAMGKPAADGAVQAAQNVRQPAAGQTWRYAKHNFYTRREVDEELDRVAAVNSSVKIDSSYKSAAKERPVPTGWGAELLRKYIVQPETPSGELPSEIQDPWGMVVLDPHWGQVQVYEMPIPLWPAQLEPGWQTHFRTQYKTPADQDSLPWDQTMKALAWETVTVPAGQFKALRFTNEIKFTHPDFSRTDSVRSETLWFAPEVGRWVARESRGSFYLADSTIVQPYNENGFRWELLEWS